MSILKSSLLVSAWTLMSRFLGFARDIVIANKLGASAASDAFFYALMIPNLLRRLFAEGAFNVAFVPVLTHVKEDDGDAGARAFASVAFTLLFIALVVVSVLAEVFMPQIIRYVIAPGHADNAELFDTIVFLSRVTFPYLALITFASLCGGILNTYGRFGPFAAVPVFLNVALIGCLMVLPEMGIAPAMAASIAVPLGGVFQVAFMIWALTKLPFKFTLTTNLNHRELMPFLKRLGPAALTVGILQVSFVIDMNLASQLGERAASYLNYANRFYQLPLALIGVALATVLLPHFSKALKSKNYTQASEDYTNSLTFGLLISGAATAGLFMLAPYLMRTFFEHGAFTAESALMSAYAMMAYCLAVPAFVITKITVTAFFANRDTKTPFKISCISLVINIIFNLILMRYWGHIGLAAATAIAGWCNATLQLYYLRKQGLIRVTLPHTFMLNMGKIAVLCSLMVVSLYAFKLGVPYAEESTLLRLIWLGGALALGGVVFAGLATAFKLLAWRDVYAALKKQPMQKEAAK